MKDIIQRQEKQKKISNLIFYRFPHNILIKSKLLTVKISLDNVLENILISKVDFGLNSANILAKKVSLKQHEKFLKKHYKKLIM